MAIAHLRNAIRIRSLLLILAIFSSASVGHTDSAAAQLDQRRPVTVADVIRMKTLWDSSWVDGRPPKDNVAIFSPDKERFVVVIKSGDLVRNVNEYSIALFRSAEVFRHPAPEILITMSSSSNRPAVQQLSWQDNRTIAFVGEAPGEEQQVYTYDITTHRLIKLTNHSTSVLSYVMDPTARRILFMARPPTQPFNNGSTERTGLVVTSQLLSDLIAGDDRQAADFRAELFSMRLESREEMRITIEDMLTSRRPHLWLSPNGDYLVVTSLAREIPDGWREYKDRLLQPFIAERLERPNREVASSVERNILVDVNSRKSQPLVDGPLSVYGSDVAWSADSRSLIVTGAFLPLNVPDATERAARQSSAFAVEVQVPGRAVTKIRAGEMTVVGWDSNTGVASFKDRKQRDESHPEVFNYRKNPNGWMEIGKRNTDDQRDAIDILLEEDMNKPPQIVAVDRSLRRKNVLLDLNPQFKELRFATVKVISWRATTGYEAVGELYLPPDYQPGRRYPLVIQTHGFNPERFWIDGPYTTAFAAQPLSNKEIIVLQLQGDKDGAEMDRVWQTTDAFSHYVAAYEGAIEYLDGEEMIDRNKVGIIGFSWTGMPVKYALTHSQYEFAAALVADDDDAGYFQYLVHGNYNPAFVAGIETMIGAPPFGKGIESWLKRSPGFALQAVQTPLLVQALGPFSVLTEWEWFSGLSRLKKPVEMVYLFNGSHVLQRPWDRMISQQGTVDWFCFWLKHEEDPDPGKRDQYARWRELRRLQVKNEKKSATREPASN